MARPGDQGGNVAAYRGAPAPAKAPGAGKTRKSAVATASLAEASRRKDMARHVEKQLATNAQMSGEQRFLMARNMRDYVYGLAQAGRLKPKDLGDRAFGRAEVRAIQRYVVPAGIRTKAEFDAAHSKREISGKPRDFQRLALAAAELAGDEGSEALLALAQGTRFWPGAGDIADEERQAANEVMGLLDVAARHLDRVFPLDRYFDLVERHEVLPVERDEGLVFDSVGEFDWFDHCAIPTVRMATRWQTTATQTVVVAVSDRPEGEKGTIDFDAILEAGGAFTSSVNRRQVFSLGMGRVAGTVGPVAVFSHEVVLPGGRGYSVERQAATDRLEPGWHPCIVDRGTGPKRAAWQLTDALKHPPGDDENFDAPPDVKIVPVTADWLLGGQDEQWMIPRATGPDAGWWNIVSMMGRSRLGGPKTLPSIVERGLLSDTATMGPIFEMRAVYERNLVALKAWKAVTDERIQARLGSVAARLGGDPEAEDDRFRHLD